MWQTVANYLLLSHRCITFSLPLSQPHKRIVVKYVEQAKQVVDLELCYSKTYVSADCI